MNTRVAQTRLSSIPRLSSALYEHDATKPDIRLDFERLALRTTRGLEPLPLHQQSCQSPLPIIPTLCLAFCRRARLHIPEASSAGSGRRNRAGNECCAVCRSHRSCVSFPQSSPILRKSVVEIFDPYLIQTWRQLEEGVGYKMLTSSFRVSKEPASQPLKPANASMYMHF
jgi:hypothetical protein